MLKTLSIAALGVAAAPIVSACGTAAPPPPAATTSAAAAKPAGAASAVELRLHVRTGNEADTLSDRLPEFEASVPGAKVKIESFPAADYFAKLQTLVAGGQLGDVLWGIVHQGWGPYFLASGVTTSLDSLIESDKFDLTQYYPVALQASRVFEGKMLGLPFKLQPFAIGLYYNATAFEEAKVQPPTLNTTQDELVQIANQMQVNDASGRPTRFGFFPALIGTAYESLVTVVRPFGGDVMSADGTKAALNTPQAVAGMRWIHDMVFKDKVAPSVQQLGGDPAMPLDSMFVAGTGAMFQSGSSAKSLPTRVKDKFVVKDTLMPMGPGNNRGSMAGVDVIMISKESKFQKESWQLTKMLCDKETGIRLGEGRGGASGTCGARPDAFNDPRLMTNPLHQVWIKAAEDAGPLYVPANFRGGEIDTLIKQKLGGLYNGDEKFEQKFFDDLNAGVQQILDKPKP